jgi:predicted deacetylase
MQIEQTRFKLYLYAAREELLVRLGISTGWVISTGNAMALSEQNLKYFTPLRVWTPLS